MGSERPNFGSEQPNSLPDFKLKFYKRQIYSFAFLGSEFFCPQPKCKCAEPAKMQVSAWSSVQQGSNGCGLT